MSDAEQGQYADVLGSVPLLEDFKQKGDFNVTLKVYADGRRECLVEFTNGVMAESCVRLDMRDAVAGALNSL